MDRQRAGYTLPRTPHSTRALNQNNSFKQADISELVQLTVKRQRKKDLKVNIQIISQKPSSIPVLVKVGHHRHGVEHVPAHGPAGSVDAVLWYFDRWETLTGQCLQRGKHGAAYK